MTPVTPSGTAVLVAYGGSEPAARVVEYAATEHDEALVVPWVAETADSSIEAGIGLSWEAPSDEEGARVVSEVVLSLLAGKAVSHRVGRVPGDSTGRTAVVAERDEIDHVVVGSHGWTGDAWAGPATRTSRRRRRSPAPPP